MTKEIPAWLIKRLNQIASFDDKLANQHLKMTGSYACFDEPGSVRIAREILAEAGALPSDQRGGWRVSKDRIVELQKSLRIAKEALEKIAYGHAHNVQDCASSALDKMWRLEPKQPLQYLVGHERKPR